MLNTSSHQSHWCGCIPYDSQYSLSEMSSSITLLWHAGELKSHMMSSFCVCVFSTARSVTVSTKNCVTFSHTPLSGAATPVNSSINSSSSFIQRSTDHFLICFSTMNSSLTCCGFPPQMCCSSEPSPCFQIFHPPHP